MSRIHSDMQAVRRALHIMSKGKCGPTPPPALAAHALAAWERVDKVLFAHISESTLKHIRTEQNRKTPRSRL
jgi:hypothetical protein